MLRSPRKGNEKMKIKIERPCKTPGGRELPPGEVVDEDYRFARYLISQGYASKVPKTGPKGLEPLVEEPANAPPSVPEAGAGVRDISEVLGEQKRRLFEGPRRSIKPLLGKAIVIERFAVMQSKYKEGKYAMIQLRDEAGKRCWTTTQSVPVLDALRNAEGILPFRCKIEEYTSADGKPYFKLVSAKEKKQRR